MNLKTLLKQRILPEIDLETQSHEFLELYDQELWISQHRVKQDTCTCKQWKHTDTCGIDKDWLFKCGDIRLEIAKLLPKPKPGQDVYTRLDYVFWPRPKVHICWSCRLTKNKTKQVVIIVVKK